jgi:hypothetical protein
MAKDLTVVLEHRPGTLAALGEATGAAGINVEGLCGVARAGQPEMHILVDDAAAARQALADAEIEVSDEREVVVHEIEDRPGAAGEVARRVADAGVNLDLVYLATGTRLVLGADDLESLKRAL